MKLQQQNEKHAIGPNGTAMRGITRGMTGEADTVSLKGEGLYKAGASESGKERLVIMVTSVSKGRPSF